MRLLLAFLVLVVLPARAQDAPLPDTLVVDLTLQAGVGPFSPSFGGMSSNADDPADPWYGMREVVEGIPEALADARLLFHDFDFTQRTFQAYRAGRIPAGFARNAFASWSTDTLALTEEWVDGRVAVLAARGDDGHVFVFDTDNDEDFADERPVRIPLEAPGETFLEGAEAEVTYEYFDGIAVRTARAPLLVNPYFEMPGRGTMHMSASPRHYAGTTEVGDDTLRWFAVPGLRDGHFKPANTEVVLLTGAEGEPTSVPNGYEPYRTGEVLEIAGRMYRLSQVTPGGERLVLVYTPDAPAAGLRKGMMAPPFTAVTLGGAPIRLEDLRGRYVLLDFWGTWCGPCVGEVPTLKAAYDAYDRDAFTILGIAEDDPAAVEAFVAEHEMAWPQIVENPSEGRDVLDTFRIQGFPTTFLLDPEGRIVARDDELRGERLAATLGRLIGTADGASKPLD